jgi:hypothetical protein
MIARRASVIALSLFAFAPAARAADPQVKLVGNPPAVHVVGLDAAALAALAKAKLSAAEWAKAARFVVDGGTPAELAARPSVAGEWSVTVAAVVFEPQFPLAPGVKYRAFLDLAAAPRAKLTAAPVALAVFIPKPPPGPRVQVTGIYPTGNRLPENTLRLYVYFSGPVARGDVYSRVKLTRDDGKVVDHPFVELVDELWSDDGLRLTLIFDPGRVKRGLAPREEHGPILEEGRGYTFELTADWKDGDGRPLLTTYKKTFTATAPDVQPVSPDDWALVAPRSADAPLTLRLAKPHDHALLARMMWVVDAEGNRVPGTMTVGGGERVVSFAPAKPWARGTYKLQIDARLEDVCGNRVGEPFEVDVFKPIPVKPVTKLAERPFAVK